MSDDFGWREVGMNFNRLSGGIYGPPPPEPTAAERERLEAQRKANLARTRTALVECDVAEAELQAADRHIARLEDAANEAVAEHQAATAPIHRALELLKSRRRAAIQAKKVPDADIEREEAIQYEKLDTANEQLKLSADKSSRLLARLTQERLAWASKCNRSNLVSDLYVYADPALLEKLKFAKQCNLLQVPGIEAQILNGG